MNIRFSKVSRGPAWERWVILEEQNGDEGFAGEAIITYSDTSSYAEAECDILFVRDLNDEEVDDLLEAASSIISDIGTITIYSTQEIISKDFDFISEMDDADEDEDEDEEEEEHHH